MTNDHGNAPQVAQGDERALLREFVDHDDAWTKDTAAHNDPVKVDFYLKQFLSIMERSRAALSRQPSAGDAIPVTVTPALHRAIESIHKYVGPSDQEIQEAWDTMRAALAARGKE